MPLSKKNLEVALEAKFYVGRRITGDFVRTFEEPASDFDDEFIYEAFTSVRKPTKKSHSRFNLVVGPFKSQRAAEIFRDREGVNTVAEAERLAQ